MRKSVMLLFRKVCNSSTVVGTDKIQLASAHWREFASLLLRTRSFQVKFRIDTIFLRKKGIKILADVFKKLPSGSLMHLQSVRTGMLIDLSHTVQMQEIFLTALATAHHSLHCRLETNRCAKATLKGALSISALRIDRHAS
jgi:hypothetical protein